MVFGYPNLLTKLCVLICNENNMKEKNFMARPAAKELTQRELEVMQAFWQNGEVTASEVREWLAKRGLDLAYVTVAT